MDKQSLLAIVLSLLILVLYQAFISRFYPSPTTPRSPHPTSQPETPPAPLEQQPPRIEQKVEQTQAQPPAEQTQAQPPAVSPVPAPAAQDITIENEVYIAIFTSLGGRLKSFRLKDYPATSGSNSPPLEMVRKGDLGALPLVVRVEGDGSTISDETVPYAVLNGQDTYLQAGQQVSIEFRGQHQSGVVFTKIFSFSGEGYGMNLEVQIDGAPPQAATLSLAWIEGITHHKATSYYDVYGPVALIGRKFVYEKAAKLNGNETFGPAEIRWAGYADNYFLAAMIPPDLLPPEGDRYQLLFSNDKGTVEAQLTIPWEREPVRYTLYVGPKETTALSAVDPALDRAIDFGMFHFIARPLVSLLRFLHSFTGNYGVDIILLTIFVKLAFFPLSNKSFKSMSQMRKLQPQLERLRERYKDDRQQLNKEMMELYRRYKVNPLGGCLPMIVQFPVFIGLYQGLMYAIELRHAGFFGWIQDLSQPDRLGHIAIPYVEPPGIPVLTLLMGGSMILQQSMTPASGDPTQQKMMMLMPIVFTVMFVNFPSGLVLYWLVNNVLSITQQYWYTKKYG